LMVSDNIPRRGSGAGIFASSHRGAVLWRLLKFSNLYEHFKYSNNSGNFRVLPFVYTNSCTIFSCGHIKQILNSQIPNGQKSLGFHTLRGMLCIFSPSYSARVCVICVLLCLFVCICSKIKSLCSDLFYCTERGQF
jgi:hypothetical protein